MKTTKLFIITDTERDMNGIISSVDEDKVAITWEDDETIELTNEELEEMLDSEKFEVEEHEVELNEESAAAATIHTHSSADAGECENPKSRLEWVTGILGNLAAMDKTSLVKLFDAQQSLIGGEGERAGLGGNADKNQHSIDMKPSAAEGTPGAGVSMKETVRKLQKEEMDALFGETDLTEEFKQKLTTLFEATVTARITEEVLKIQEDSEKKVEAAINEKIESLVEAIETYCEMAKKEWFDENEIAIESALRTELTNEFMEDLKECFSKNYINIPEEKVEVYESLVAAHQEAEEELNKALNENIEKDKIINALQKEKALSESFDGLTIPQRDKLQKLTSEVVFEDDESFKTKVTTIKEAFLKEEGKGTPVPKSAILTEGLDKTEEEVKSNSNMTTYVETISRLVK